MQIIADVKMVKPVEGLHGMIIADKGLIGAAYQNELREFTGIDLQTAGRSKMEKRRSKKFLKWLGNVPKVFLQSSQP